MADESNMGPVAAAVAADAEVKAPTAKKKRSQPPQKAAAAPAQPKAPAAKPRRYREQETNDKLELIETQVSEGETFKDDIQSAGISEQTHYHSKGAARISAQKDDKGTNLLRSGDELADLIELEEENQRLRKRLAKKLRAENAELRKKLGLD
ncbi:transcriptional regulator [Sinorhizobium meliloti]|uniref:transcriptional regulator n=1 Tax=Rhizobium meliloti TaxID=382 RepID=UPI000FD21F6F|nr:transcriptional regulator [Sinorhizobium meliloti]RVE81211.1 transcriptional regulator [Sinorhizobium meliloti]RVE97494.1 transcriptional regulator [Sinorhizobium meliloti]RVM94351.1 transcriptional regulator [Sinorhizobium meliloti]